DTQPKVVLARGILMMISFTGLFPNQKIINVTNPNFKFPDPQSKKFNEEYFNQFDGGEKYVMLKGLYKIYTLVTWELLILAFGIMYYFAFTGDSQVVSINDIGVLLMLIKVSYTISLRPK